MSNTTNHPYDGLSEADIQARAQAARQEELDAIARQKRAEEVAELERTAPSPAPTPPKIDEPLFPY